MPPTVTADPHAYRLAVWTIAYSTFFKFESFFVMLLVMVAGPNLISQDLRFNALPLYFSRPLRRWDYFLGKLGVIAALVAAVAVIPAVVAYLLGVCFSLDLTVIRDTWRLLPASILYGLLIAVSAGTLMLALSSLSRRSLYVGISWVGLWIISAAVATVLGAIHHEGFVRTAMKDMKWQPGVMPPPGRASKQPGGPERWRGWQQVQERATQAEALVAPTNWRPLCSYTANLMRLGEALFDTDAAFVQFGRAMVPPPTPLGLLLGTLRKAAAPPQPAAPSPERRLADQFVPQYPWIWSAGILAGLLGLSLWTLSMRVKSLDQLR
jgi:ABC-2 type transport system permease protein